MDYMSHIKGIVHENNTLIEKPPFVTMSSITFQLQNIVERNKCSWGVLFATKKGFFQLQTNKVDKYKSKMEFYLNTTTITSSYHLSYKSHTTIVNNCFQLLSTSG
jgi:hypothetical protein